MANLPIYSQEAEAFAAAQEMLKQSGSWVAHPWQQEDERSYDPFDRDASRRFAFDAMKWLAGQRADYLAIVIDWARAGWGLADEVVRALHTEMVDRGSVSNLINVYVNDVIRGSIGSRKPAQRKEDNFLRDVSILIMVIVLVEKYGLRPTRNPTTQKKASACSIVAATVGMTEPAVVAIYTRMKKHL